VVAEYKGTHPLVELARAQNGKTDWAWANARAPYPRKTNKCNQFMYEMVTDAGYAVPPRPYKSWKGLGPIEQLPPLAGDWADASKSMGSSTIVTLPEPGDVIAWSHAYADASGHVGIVTYPLADRTYVQELGDGDDVGLTVEMRRQSISAHELEVGEGPYTFWHYYDEGNSAETSQIVFRRFP
jgi:hypothetical protein